jgi:hypothetical protein
VQGFGACGSEFGIRNSESAIPAPAPEINIQLSTVAWGAHLTLTATVSGTSNTGLTWSVNGVTDGNSTTGMLTGSGLTRTYTAPSINVPNPNPVTFEIVSTEDTASTATATATVTDSIAVTLSPTTTSVTLNGT